MTELRETLAAFADRIGLRLGPWQAKSLSLEGDWVGGPGTSAARGANDQPRFLREDHRKRSALGRGRRGCFLGRRATTPAHH